MPKVTLSPAMLKILRDPKARRVLNELKTGVPTHVLCDGEIYTITLDGDPIPPERILVCPDCGQQTDGGSRHTKPTGDDCMTVMGRRGWRQLGDYDS